MIKIYKRIFTEEKYEEIIQKRHIISNYFPVEMEISLFKALGVESKTLIPSDKLYILCPYYQDGDFQIGITGTVKINESNTVGLKRELAEEVGLIPEYKYIDLIKTFTKKSKTFNCYCCDISGCKNIKTDDQIINNKPDDRTRKVGCYIYGTEEEILNYLSSDIELFKSEDRIIGVVAIKIKDAIQQLNLLGII